MLVIFTVCMLGIAVILMASSVTVRDSFSYWFGVTTKADIKRAQVLRMNNNPIASTTPEQDKIKQEIIDMNNPTAKMTAAQIETKKAILNTTR